MELPNKLGQLVDEYLNENDKKNIQGIFITIPDHKGFFFIMDSFRLTLRESDPFSLSISFSFNDKTKKGKSLVDKVHETKCFSGFTIMNDGRQLTYSRNFGDDKQSIVDNVELIVNGLFPHISTNSVKIELKRITSWFTIQE